MKQKTLFEIPIYSMPEKVFNGKWNKKKSELFELFVNHGHTRESADEGIFLTCYPRDIWKYNQIIGYITISVSQHDIWFDVIKSLDTVYYATSKTKHFMQDVGVLGMHFYVQDESDEEIHTEIREWLRMIENEQIRRTMFVDYSVFDNIFDSINIKEIMMNI